MPPEPIKPITSSDSLIREALLIRIPMIQNVASMAYALGLIRQHFEFPGLIQAQPPMPDDVISLIPSSVVITDKFDIATGERVGRIRFLRDIQAEDMDDTLYDREWMISPADRPERGRL